MHNVAWDHAALWMLRGTKPEKSLGLSCTAIAEAMGATSFASLLGLLAAIPFLGTFMFFLLAPLDVYYWCLRGIGLAAYHGCPVWKGVAATVLHVCLVFFFYGLVFLAALFIVAAVMPV
jgi:hypothetical protein